MAIKPVTDDLLGWLQLQTTPTDSQMALYDECMADAVDTIESRVNLPEGTTDTNYPQRIRTAILMEAARIVSRSSSPQGVAGFGDMGVVIRVAGTDPDIERKIMRYLKLDGFA